MFNPQEFLVAILPDDVVAEQGRTALESSGFLASDLRVYTCEEILAEHERYLNGRGTARTILSRITARESDYEFYAALASEGRGALWVHVTERHDASRAMRYLVMGSKRIAPVWSVRPPASRSPGRHDQRRGDQRDPSCRQGHPRRLEYLETGALSA